MVRTVFARPFAVASLSILSSGLFAVTAAADGIDVTEAAIKGGKLVVSGTTSLPSTRLRLDGRSEEAFNTVSKANRAFKFSVAYLPKDCVVSVSRISAGGQVSAGAELVIAGCSPASLTPRGNWSAKDAYEVNDIVSYKGSSWLARKDNAGQAPKDGEAWQLLVEKGAQGADGNDGAAGASGSAASGGGAATPLAFAGALAAAARAVPSGPAGGDLTGTYPNPQIKANAVTEAEIHNFAVSTTKLKNSAVTNVKIHDNAVSNTKILDGAVTTSKITDRAVTTAKIAIDAVTRTELANNAVGPENLSFPAHEHFGASTNIADSTAHDGAYATSTSTVSCGTSETLLSAHVKWTGFAGHNEVMFSGIDSIDRSTNPQTATVRAAFDGGAGPATYQAVAVCLF